MTAQEHANLFVERIFNACKEEGITDKEEMLEVAQCILLSAMLKVKVKKHGTDGLTDNEKEALQIIEDWEQEAQKEQAECTVNKNVTT